MPRLFVHRMNSGVFYIYKFLHSNEFDATIKSTGFVSEEFSSPLFDSLDLAPGETCAIIIYRDKRGEK